MNFQPGKGIGSAAAFCPIGDGSVWLMQPDHS
jgi:hypothetical protein